MSCERNDRSVRVTTAPTAVRAESLRFSSSTSIRYSCPTQDLCTRPIRTSIFEIWTCDQDAPDYSKKNGRPTDGTNGWSLPKSAETLSSSETIDDRRSTIASGGRRDWAADRRHRVAGRPTIFRPGDDSSTTSTYGVIRCI